MHAVTPVPFCTPDGVQRELRWTLGAQKRIANQFGNDLQKALNENGDGMVPDLGYACMYDKDGNPPADLTAKQLAESLAEPTELLAAFLSARSQGQTPKNEFEVLLTKAAKKAGWNGTPSARSASGSRRKSSGTVSSRAKSTPESRDTSNSETPKTADSG